MKKEILKIIETSLKKDFVKVKKYSKLLSMNLMEEDPEFSKAIKEILEKNMIDSVYFDDFVVKPKDKDSNLDMVDVITNSDYGNDLILDNLQQDIVNSFIKSYEKKDLLKKYNIEMNFSLLLYGNPGTGKTALAHFISKQLKLPLVIVKIDALISSLLGNTAKNIRKVFEYANSKKCILFLDEFDALAKLRDDSKELGELKRVVNSLLQNIDSFIGDNILLAATNHEKLLDSAVWRRFTVVLNTDDLSLETKYKILKKALEKTNLNFKLTKNKIEALKFLIKDLTPSEIKKVVISSIRTSILNDETTLSYYNIIYQFYIFKKSSKSLIGFLKEAKLTKKEISNNLGISLKKIDKELKGVSNEEKKYNKIC